MTTLTNWEFPAHVKTREGAVAAVQELFAENDIEGHYIAIDLSQADVSRSIIDGIDCEFIDNHPETYFAFFGMNTAKRVRIVEDVQNLRHGRKLTFWQKVRRYFNTRWP